MPLTAVRNMKQMYEQVFIGFSEMDREKISEASAENLYGEDAAVVLVGHTSDGPTIKKFTLMIKLILAIGFLQPFYKVFSRPIFFY